RTGELLIVRIGLSLCGVVGLITSRKRGAVREMMIDPGNAVALESLASSGKNVLAGIACDGAVGLREKRQIRPHGGTDRDAHGLRARGIAEYRAIARVGRKGERDVRQSFDFAQLLIIRKKEGLVPGDRSSQRTAELIAVERRLLRVEEVARVELAVAQKLKNASVKLVRARLKNGGHHAAGGSSILRRILVGQDAEFADRFHAEIHVQSAARAGVGVVVHHQAVDQKDIARGPAAGNRERFSVAARGARVRKAGRRLLSDSA